MLFFRRFFPCFCSRLSPFRVSIATDLASDFVVEVEGQRLGLFPEIEREDSECSPTALLGSA